VHLKEKTTAESLADLAAALGSYYESLIVSGIPEVQAGILVSAMQETLLERLREAASAPFEV
jgi:hypothetical protein